MSTKKKKGKASDNTEIRFAGINWDKEQPVNIHRDTRNIRRKVLTRKIIRINAARVLEAIIEKLRQGNEVRLCDGDTDAVRFYPCIKQDMKTMFVACSSMGDFRDSLSDKKAKLFRFGEERSAKDMVEFQEAVAKEVMTCKHVSPSTMVRCPKCGETFRVGKQLV